jgi:hypothetical protein
VKSLLKTATATAFAFAMIAAPAYAQRVNTGGTGAFGQVQLTSGFEPDPYLVTVNGGGPIDASTLGDGCTGYIAQRASFTLRYRKGDLPLFIAGVSEADTTIVVRAPDGRWYCDDDSGGNLNPQVSWDAPRSGRYQIWLGRFGNADEIATGSLHISELGGPGEQAGGAMPTGGPDMSLDPAYGTAELASGFQPDPHTVAIAAGGAIDASIMGVEGCVGWIAQPPDYRVNWTAGSGSLPLVFSVTSEADTTLVINDAQGNWVCNDDGGNSGLNPSIRFDAPVSGQYDIWVGTFSQGDLQQSTLNVSELYSQ